MKQTYLECGKIINTHGFKGDVKLESWCDSPAVLAGLKTVYLLRNQTYTAFRVLHASVFKQFVLMSLEGITDETQANTLRGNIVYANREDIPLPEGSHFLADLIGLPILHADTGENLGRLIRIDQSSATDLYVIKTSHGEELLPAVPEFVIRTVPEEAIYVRPIPGLLDGEADNA